MKAIVKARSLTAESQFCSARSTGILARITAVALAVAPILDPYIVGSFGLVTVRLMDVVLIILASIHVLGRRTEGLNDVKSLCFLLVALLFCTIVSSFFSIEKASSVSALGLIAKYGIYAVCFGMLLEKTTLSLMARYATVIALIATGYIILQYFLVGGFYVSIWDGVLPFPINDTDGFSPLFDRNTGEIRPRAFFQESSYYAIYSAPVLIKLILDKKKVATGILILGLLLSTSFLGVVVIAIGAFLLINGAINERGSINWTVVALIASLIGLAGICVIVLYSLGVLPQLNSFLEAIESKVASIIHIDSENAWGRSSAQYRLLGNIELFGNYSPLEKVFGVGMGQYASVYSQEIESAYSNTAVTILLNCGLLGLTCMTIWLVGLFFNCSNKMKTFPLLFAIFVFTDNFWFNWYFFYVLAWVVAAKRDCDRGVMAACDHPIS